MFAGVCEKSLEVYLKATCIVLCKSDSADKSLVIGLTVEECAVDSCEVNKIESASAHYEESLKYIA